MFETKKRAEKVSPPWRESKTAAMPDQALIFLRIKARPTKAAPIMIAVDPPSGTFAAGAPSLQVCLTTPGVGPVGKPAPSWLLSCPKPCARSIPSQAEGVDLANCSWMRSSSRVISWPPGPFCSLTKRGPEPKAPDTGKGIACTFPESPRKSAAPPAIIKHLRLVIFTTRY